MLAIIQARMSSRRLPGKVLCPLAGKPMLGWVHARLSRSRSLNKIIIATSDDVSDDPICEFCSQYDIACHRGSLEDVATRFLECAEQEGAVAFLRISGDSPLIDSEIVDRAVALQASTECDLATNVQVRSFPKGQSVEVVRTAALAEALPYFRDAQDREHVTRYFYAYPQNFTINNLACDMLLDNVQLSVDTRDDFKAIEAILQRAGEQVSWRAAAALRVDMKQC